MTTDLGITEDIGVRLLRIAGQPLTRRLARQLDVIGIDKLNITGRVNLGGKRKRKRGERLVIGIGKEDSHRAGQLVLATYKRYTFDYRWWVDLADNEKMTICQRVRYDGVGRHLIRYTVDSENPNGMWLISRERGITFEIEPGNVQKCNVNHMTVGTEPCAPLVSMAEDLKEYLNSQWEEAREEQALHVAARNSPLILLP